MRAGVIRGMGAAALALTSVGCTPTQNRDAVETEKQASYLTSTNGLGSLNGFNSSNGHIDRAFTAETSI